MVLVPDLCFTGCLHEKSKQGVQKFNYTDFFFYPSDDVGLYNHTVRSDLLLYLRKKLVNLLLLQRLDDFT